MRDGSTATSGKLRFDWARIWQSPQGGQGFPQGVATPSVANNRCTRSMKNPSLTLVIEKCSEIRSAGCAVPAGPKPEPRAQHCRGSGTHGHGVAADLGRDGDG